MEKRYAHMGLRELQVRVLNKYSELLKRDKSVYVISKNHYFGINYGLFDEETIKDFDRKDLELLLSNKFSALRTIESENFIVLHDGNSKFVIANLNGYNSLAVWSGKIRNGEIEIIHSEGSWTWVKDYTLLDEYKVRVEEKINELILEVQRVTGKDLSEEITNYYSNLKENGIPEYDKIIFDSEKYTIALSNTSEDDYDYSHCISHKRLDNYCYPTLILEHKEEYLTPLQVKYSSLEDLSDSQKEQYKNMLNKKINNLLETNELQIIDASKYNIKFTLWNHKVYLAFDSDRTGEMRYCIYNTSTGTRWMNKIYSPVEKYFSIYRKVEYIAQESIITDVIESSLKEAKNDIKKYFTQQKIQNGCLMSELIVYLINKLSDNHLYKSSKESIMDIFR